MSRFNMTFKPLALNETDITKLFQLPRLVYYDPENDNLVIHRGDGANEEFETPMHHIFPRPFWFKKKPVMMPKRNGWIRIGKL